jgi:DNA polymerase III subunit chi
MTRIDFYVLPETGDTGPVLTACRLCDKAVDGGLRVYAYTPDAALAEDLDHALWTFRQGSFIGHERMGKDSRDLDLCSVVIGDTEPPATHQDVLVNLGNDVPPFIDRFQRVLEIVHGDAQSRARLRERFKHYRERGYEPATHKL